MSGENEAGTAAGPEGDSWFGFRRVATGQKTALVRGVFGGVARRYDLMNDLMSAGIHRLWKAAMVDRLAPCPGQRIADIAGGTGDIAFRILAHSRGRARVTVCDLTPEMLAVGRNRAIDRGILAGIDWVAGNAEDLPFADRSMDAYAIAFGLRNVARLDRALVEARRVLKPGGRLVCLEFSHVGLPLLRRAYDLYSFRVLPALGAAVAGDRDSYRYLVESIRRFPSQEALAGRMTAAGLEQVSFRNLSGGIAALHAGWRI